MGISTVLLNVWLARSPRSWPTRRHIILADGNLGESELIRTRKDREPQEQLVGTVARAAVARTAVGRAAVTELIVETNFQHLNLAVRRESVSQERPRPKRLAV